jgi:hypothetical protein
MLHGSDNQTGTACLFEKFTTAYSFAGRCYS